MLLLSLRCRAGAVLLAVNAFLPLSGHSSPEAIFTLPAPPLELVQSAAKFEPFARAVAAEADRQLHAATRPAPATYRFLLSVRVHLAIYLGENELALDLAAKIRAGQSEPGERAHSGLTTRALVSSRRDPAAFEAEFTRLLRGLPRDELIRDALIRARAKIAGLSEATLLADVRNVVAPRLARGEPCTLELADHLVRAGHRLRTILPLRAAMLRAYDDAIAAQR